MIAFRPRYSDSHYQGIFPGFCICFMIPHVINIENSCCKKPNRRGRKHYFYINRMRVQKIRPDHAQPAKEQKDSGKITVGDSDVEIILQC